MTRDQAENAAALWLLRREEPGWSEKDQVELDAWLDADPSHEVALWRLEYGAGKLELKPALADAPTAMPALRRGLIRRSAGRWGLAAGVAIAACLAVTAVLAPALFLHGPTTYATEIGGRELLSLTDGSRVELNTATRLRTELSPSRRVVWLDRGEAYFDVAHDAAHPFVVHAGSKTITVLGTRFSVRRDGDRVQVSVVEGRVRVEDAARRHPADAAVMTRGDIAVADTASTLVVPRSMERVTDELSWREGRLRFRETTLAEAAEEFNRYNRTRLVIADARAASAHIGGNFDPLNVQDFARLLQRAYGFRVEQDGEALKVSSPP